MSRDAHPFLPTHLHGAIRPWPAHRMWGLALHQARLTLRERFGAVSGKSVVAMVVIGLGVTMLIGLASFGLFSILRDPNIDGLVKASFGGAVACLVGVLILANSMVSAAQALQDRGDLDLLATAPISPDLIALARALGGLAAGAVVPLFITSTLVALPTFFLSPLYIFGLVAMVGWALLVMNVAQTMVGLLHHFLGKTRARIGAQILSMAIAMPMILLPQLMSTQGDVHKSFVPVLADMLARLMDGNPALRAWGEGFLNHPLNAVLIFAAGVVFTLVAAPLNGRLFAAATQQSEAPKAQSRAAMARPLHTTPRLTLLIRKEWRDLLRNPWLLTHLGFQLVALAPIMFSLSRFDADMIAISIWTVTIMVTVFATQIVGTLAWLVVSADEAIMLAHLAPLPRWQLAVAKMALPAAIGAMVSAICVTAMIFMGLHAAIAGLLVAQLFAFTATCFLEWRRQPRASKHGKSLNRLRDRPTASVYQAMLLSLISAVLGVLATQLSAWVILPILAYIGGLYLFDDGRQIRD